MRRLGIFTLATLLVLSVYGGGRQRHEAIAGPSPWPNILVIVTDDQRVDTLSVMRKTRRWLARGGTNFRRAFATTPLCCPSRASLFTARYAHNHRVEDNTDAHLLDQDQTIQRILHDAGYQTGIVGKYFNGWLEATPPHFDRWAIYEKMYKPTWWNVQGRLQKETRYAPDVVTARAVQTFRWFERKDHPPWLLFITPFSPHPWGIEPAQRHRGAPVPRWRPSPAVGEADKSDKPLFVQEAAWRVKGARRLRRKQLRALLAVDDMMGRLRQELGRLGERSRTLVLFLSDHGMMWAEHGLRRKELPYTESVRIPLLARWPGHIEAGVRDFELVTNVDVATTILEAAGQTRETDGRSLLATERRDRLLLEHSPKARRIPWTWASMRTRTFQYIEWYDNAGLIVFREYYDLRQDPWQLENLLRDADAGNDPAPEMLAMLSSQLAADRTCAGSTCP